MASSPVPGKVNISAEVADVYGNQVLIHNGTLTEHIETNHPEMAGHIDKIVDAIRDPDCGRPSTVNPKSVAWEKSFPNVAGGSTVRVLVAYGAVNYQDGGCLGRVQTAYPNNPGTRSNVGDPIYQRPRK